MLPCPLSCLPSYGANILLSTLFSNNVNAYSSPRMREVPHIIKINRNASYLEGSYLKFWGRNWVGVRTSEDLHILTRLSARENFSATSTYLWSNGYQKVHYNSALRSSKERWMNFFFQTNSTTNEFYNSTITWTACDVGKKTVFKLPLKRFFLFENWRMC